MDVPECTTETCAGGHDTDRDFYVTVQDAGRTGYLLGPYAEHQPALDNVERGRQLAYKANDRAWFYAYGTASVPRGTAITAVFQ